MPYNPAKTKDLLQVAHGYKNGVYGDYITDLAAQLIDAEAEIKTANNRAAKAENELNRVSEERDTAVGQTRKLREGNSGHKAMYDSLTAISLNPKGAAKIAKATLAKLGDASA